jgi:hypothetical protein
MTDPFIAHEQAWKQALDAALVNETCFCAHGCSNPAKPTHFVFDHPGICPDCRKAGRSKAGRKIHFVMRRALDNYDFSLDDDYLSETEPTGIRRVVRYIVDAPKRAEATEFVREYRNGFQFLNEMGEQVRAGKELTGAQVARVLRMKASDAKSDATTLKRAIAAAAKVERATPITKVDLNRLRLDGLADGKYAVESDDKAHDLLMVSIKRPTRGKLHGFTLVYVVSGEDSVRCGMQRPPAWREQERNPRFYQGYMPSVVHKVLSDPEGARNLYKQAVAAGGRRL